MPGADARLCPFRKRSMGWVLGKPVRDQDHASMRGDLVQRLPCLCSFLPQSPPHAVPTTTPWMVLATARASFFPVLFEPATSYGPRVRNVPTSQRSCSGIFEGRACSSQVPPLPKTLAILAGVRTGARTYSPELSGAPGAIFTRPNHRRLGITHDSQSRITSPRRAGPVFLW